MDYEKWFKSFARTSFDKDGTARTYGNDMENIYQMFKARLLAELIPSNADADPIVNLTKVSL